MRSSGCAAPPPEGGSGAAGATSAPVPTRAKMALKAFFSFPKRRLKLVVRGGAYIYI